MNAVIAAASACALTAAMLVSAACGGGTTSPHATPTLAPAADPAQPGPYAVGLTKMTFTRTSTVTGAPRALETWIWYPADGALGQPAREGAAPATSGGPFPIVVFSHGSGGEPDSQTFLTEHLASWGFVVVAPPHPGNTTADCFPCGDDSIIPSARERPADVEFALSSVAALTDDPAQSLGKIVDPSRTALAGHSFGGWTALFDAPSGHFNAVVALAPGLPRTLLFRVTNITVPSLTVAGGKDEIVPEDGVRAAFAAIPATTQKTLVVFPEGHHLTFVDHCFGCTAALPEARGHELTDGYVTAFLETYVVHDGRYAGYLAAAQPPDAEVVLP